MVSFVNDYVNVICTVYAFKEKKRRNVLPELEIWDNSFN